MQSGDGEASPRAFFRVWFVAVLSSSRSLTLSPATMSKGKNHTTHNQGHKIHKNGIHRPKQEKYIALKGMDPAFLRNQRFAKKHNVHHPKQEKKTE
ncbi:putative large subunit ribosomal protein L29e [Paratrimastix pyriformis]|uniref:60S ribosomal protein L29 n=1 Tax=Paratrimastix pyriformis TaxID=342808 RepID=A0ABQ8UAC0_9EUKA|nr:putative large subunit ribosomal protein L29e [Paratrimastix pyriformis]